MSGEQPAVGSYFAPGASRGQSEGQPLGAHVSDLPDMPGTQVRDASFLFTSIAEWPGRKQIALILARRPGLPGLPPVAFSYALTADEARTLAATLISMAEDVEKEAMALADAALERARKGPAK